MEVVAAKSLSNKEVVDAFWHGGNLKFLMHDGQRRCRDQIHAWRAIDQNSDTHSLIAGSMPRVFCVAKAGRFGGTTLLLWIMAELQVWFAEKHKRPMFLRFTSAWQKSIDEIIGAIVPQCFETAPPECRPQYFGKRGTKPAGLYFPVYGPMNGGSIALAGLDMNPDATRGQASDGDVVSEAAFVKKLDYTLRSVLYRQYQGRPWARAFIESSAPKDLHTDWERIYVPDCKMRGAYFSATIEDNSRLSRAEKDAFISAAGGRGNANCEREYFNVISGDPQKRVFPEFEPAQFVRDMPRPKHAYALAGFDPGFRHLFGALWAYYDFERATIVVQDSWAGSNASTAKVACITAAREYSLYGALPPMSLSFIPLERDDNRLGWRDYLRGDRCEELADDLFELSTMAPIDRPDYEHRPGKFVRFDRPGQWTYYDNVSRHEFMPNPETRVADVDLKLIADMRETFGFDFQTTTKETLRGMVNNARAWFSQGRIVFLPDCGPVIDHVHAAQWADDGKKLDEHSVYGHYDLAAALTYAIRYFALIENLNPMPPVGVIESRDRPGAVVERMPWQTTLPHELEVDRRIEAFEAELAAERGRMRDPVRMRPFK
jgi:hypothetical protein